MYCHRIRAVSLWKCVHIIVNCIQECHWNADLNIVGESVRSEAAIKEMRKEIRFACARCLIRETLQGNSHVGRASVGKW